MSEERHVRVGFDATSLIGARTGIGQVATGMLRTLAARDDVDPRPFAVTWRGRAELGSRLPELPVAARRIPARVARLLWTRFGRPRAEHWTGPVDVVHAPNFVAPPAASPVVVTVHDLTFVRFPELCTADVLTYDGHLRRALDAGATVHAVSDFVADEVRAHFALEPDRVTRIYAGVMPSGGGSSARGRALAGSDAYVLALGTVEPRKNLPTLVRAFDTVAGAQPDLALVIAGPTGGGVDDLERAVADARHADRVRRIGYVGDTDRRDLLAGATGLAYPSLYEGFGHPPLEAMTIGVPVVASNAGALPEVLGDAALLVDPGDTTGLADALERVVTDPTTRATLVERGRRQAARYAWPRAGDELAALYRRVRRR